MGVASATISIPLSQEATLVRSQDGYTGLFLNVNWSAIRLANIDGVENMLQFQHAGIWGSVCDDRFSTFDAEVAYRLLGFTSVSNVNTSVKVPSDSSFLMDDVYCDGFEQGLGDCRFLPIVLLNIDRVNFRKNLASPLADVQLALTCRLGLILAVTCWGKAWCCGGELQVSRDFFRAKRASGWQFDK